MASFSINVSGLTAMFNIDEFRENARQMVDFLVDYYKTLESQNVVSNVEPGFLFENFQKTPPEESDTFQNLLKEIQTKIMPGITHWQHPNFFGFFPCQVSPPAFLGDMLSSGLGIIGFHWLASPACTELEMLMLDWLGGALGLPDKFLFHKSKLGGGIIQGSDGEGIVVTLLAAKVKLLKMICNNKEKEAEIVSKLVVYTSDQAHSSLKKACIITGLNLDNFRALTTKKRR